MIIIIVIIIIITTTNNNDNCTTTNDNNNDNNDNNHNNNDNNDNTKVSDVNLVLHVGSTIHGAPFVAEAKRHLKDRRAPERPLSVNGL